MSTVTRCCRHCIYLEIAVVSKFTTCLRRELRRTAKHRGLKKFSTLQPYGPRKGRGRSSTPVGHGSMQRRLTSCRDSPGLTNAPLGVHRPTQENLYPPLRFKQRKHSFSIHGRSGISQTPYREFTTIFGLSPGFQGPSWITIKACDNILISCLVA